MNHLLIVLPVWADNAAQAEKLCDWIFHLGGKVRQGHVLIVAAPDTHTEMLAKLKLSAEITFDGAELIVFKPEDTTGWEKPQWINSIFAHAANYVVANYRWPWLWLEPDCVPVRRDWIEHLSQAYYDQPKPFAGPILSDGKGRLNLSRVAIYPFNAKESLLQYCGSLVPFEMLAGAATVPRSTKLRLIQQMKYVSDESYALVRQDAVLVHSDKQGLLLARLQNQPPITNGHAVPILTLERTPMVFDPPPTAPARNDLVVKRPRGRPRKVQV